LSGPNPAGELTALPQTVGGEGLAAPSQKPTPASALRASLTNYPL